ncbi:MAG: hypothetical protein E5Y07_10025 [Mesorhizobium sp.]|nr:MAG: hypothetical protein E5Y07_10025 [Mesorhizobium sp.]
MKRDWPGFRASHIARRKQSARWIGTASHLQPYKIEIRYTVAMAPEVRVLSPALIRLPGNEEGSLPHVYDASSDPTLCLYDPATDEWQPSMPLSQKIVPWTLDWLACYEFWLMTEKWPGGGRHPQPRIAGDVT